MADDPTRKNRNHRPEEENESGQPGGGVGRREDVRGSGVYPASAGDAPDDAVVRAPGEWGEGAGGKHGGRSELHLSEEELRAAERGEITEEGLGSEDRPE